jgi:gliding motility-associated-like protein
MFSRIIISFLLLLFFKSNIYSQGCTTLGQTPSTAFPVCGTDVFQQATVPICVNQKIPNSCAQFSDLIFDKNPYWYKFRCYVSGTLGFVITPNKIGDDYDWEIFDVTGRNPNDVYSDKSLIVTYNWSGNTGLTGAAAGSGTGLFNCVGNAFPTFNDMANLVQGHDYLLIVSHFDNSQSGYQLSFGGGTASLTDPTPPRFKSAFINCDGTLISLNLTKRAKCNSLASDGSDFIISPSGNIASASGINCSGAFDLDSITILLSTPLPPGNYTLTAKNGTDGNTLLDNCNVMLPVGDKVDFTVSALQPTPMDSITPVQCKPSSLHLVFKKSIRCNSIAADGSDFTVTGPAKVSVVTATGTCDANGGTTSIDVKLANPIQLGGIYKINLKTGSDGNTLIDECGQQSLAASLNFIVADTVSAFFSFQVNAGCHFDTLRFNGPSTNGITLWNWSLNGNLFSAQQNPGKVFPASGQFPVKLLVSNGVCTDSSVTTIILDDEVKAAFETNNIICPEDTASFKNTSTGKINSYLWNFGNGITSTQQNPPSQTYPKPGVETYYTISLTVSGTNGCVDNTTQKIQELKSCYIGVPNAFTPNEDGLNDFFYPLNAFKADDLDFRVYNRWGQLVFKTNDWTKKWNGKIKDIPQPVGAYVWTMRYTHHDTGKKYSLRGTTMLIR